MHEKDSIAIMKKYLEQYEIPVEIWYFDPKAKDDVYNYFKNIFIDMSDNIIKEKSKLRIDAIKKLKKTLLRDDINSLGNSQKITYPSFITLVSS